MSLFLLPRSYTADANGQPRVGAKAYFYQAGTSTPITVYTGPTFAITHPNPVPSLTDGLFPAIYINPTTNPTYKFVLTDANDVPIYSEDNIVTPVDVTAAVIGSLLYPRTAAEIAALVTPSDYSFVSYNRARYASWADWKAACDQADAEGIVNGAWALTADIELPNKCTFTGALSGAFTVLYQKRSHGWVNGLQCYKLVVRGLNFCTLQNCFMQFCDVDGFDNGYGTFWNEFIQFHVDKTLKIDITNWAVNSNSWHGGRVGYLHITGNQVTYPTTQAHSNSFFGVDFTDNGNVPSGVLQDDTAYEVNYLYGCYYEGGGDIAGNFHIFGFQGDGQGMPAIARFAHIMGAVGRNPKMCRDFLSLTVNNLAVGGNWDILDSSGKPPCISHVGGASVSVNADTTEPSGAGSRYEASFADAFDEFRITLQPSGSNRFGLMIFYKSTADFVSFESLADAVTTSLSATAVLADPPTNTDNWKILRITGPASKTGTTVVRMYAYGASGGAAKVMSIGGVFGGAERAVISPQRPTTRLRYGSATYDAISLADGAGETKTVTVTGAALGDFVQASFSLDVQGITVTAWVSSANTVSARFQNESGGVIDLASGTLRVQTQTPYA